MDYSYLITPFFTWMICGLIKFFINSIKTRSLAFNLIGYGGMPSNHSAIVSSMISLVFFKEGVQSASFGIALTIGFIVILDASSLRKQVGKHAEIINYLNKQQEMKLRERIGHSQLEILAGIVLGSLLGCAISLF